MNQQVTWKMFLKMMLTIAFPIAMQNLLTNTASMVDTIMIGNQGERQWRQWESVPRSVLCSLIVTGDSQADPSCFLPSTGVQGMRKELTVPSVLPSSVWPLSVLDLDLCPYSTLLFF